MKLVQILLIIKTFIMTLGPQLKKVDSIEDVKELKEGVIGVNELSLFLISRLKDGADLGDLKAVWDKWSDDEEFKSKMKAAIEGASRMKAEVEDIDAGEGLELLDVQLDYLPRILSAFKAE